MHHNDDFTNYMIFEEVFGDDSKSGSGGGCGCCCMPVLIMIGIIGLLISIF